MAIENDNKVDFLWKKVIYRRAETDIGKQAPNEFLPSPAIVLQNQVWSESDSIPVPADQTTTNIVEYYPDSIAIECVADPTVVGAKTWLAVLDSSLSPFLTSNRMQDWIPSTVHPSYLIKVYAGDPSTDGLELNQLAANEEWVWDDATGILHFPNNVPASLDGKSVFVTGYRYVGAKGIAGGGGAGSGDQIVLGTPTDGDLTDPKTASASGPAVNKWTSDTKVTDAIDDLNEVLGLLIPPPPPSLEDIQLSMSGGFDARGGDAVLLADSVPDFTVDAAAPSAGDRVYRVTNTSSSATTLEFGSGNSGTLTALVNGQENGSIVLSGDDNTGTADSLQIVSDVDFPSDKPGFWQAIRAKVSTAVSVGLNVYQLSHDEDGLTNKVFFVKDDQTAKPTTTNVTVSENSAGTLAYSSGVPHYSSGASVAVSATVSDLCGKTYLDDRNIQVSSEPLVGSNIDIGVGTGNLPAVLTADMAPYNLEDEPFVITGNHHATSRMRVRGRNSVGDGDYVFGSQKLNVMSGTAGNAIAEMSIPVNNMGSVPTSDNAARVIMGAGDTPVDDFTGTVADWDSSVSVAAHDATVVGGVLQHDVTDYSSYLPAGPNLSTQGADQYVTFMFRRRAQSGFKIILTGNYSGMWVKLPGITTNGTLNGWWDAFELYDGAGVPDVGSNGVGCAAGAVATGSTGTTTVTFGTQSSTNSTNNIVLVRFKLTSGDFISRLSFDGV